MHLPDDCCARCGNDELVTTVHLDGDKSNNRWWNLIPLCMSCYGQEIEWISRVTGAWRAPDWIQPYLAGFYAWDILGMEYTPVEVQCCMVELLALGQSRHWNHFEPGDDPDFETYRALVGS